MNRVIVVLVGVQTVALIIVGLILVALWAGSSQRERFEPLPVPGATPEEQRGTIVSKAFALGRLHRSTILQSHGDSWDTAAQSYEAGEMPWGDIKRRWAESDRPFRDGPFDRVIQPEIDRILGSKSAGDAARRHDVTLFVRAFAAGLKDRR